MVSPANGGGPLGPGTAGTMSDKRAAYLSWLGGALRPPHQMIIDVTEKCNLRCGYCDCPAAPLPEEVLQARLDEGALLRLVREGLEMGIGRFDIPGSGEPFLREQLVLEIMRDIKTAGAYGSISTNGTLLSREAMLAMVELGWDNLTVSLDSHTRKIADALRGAGVFDRVVRDLRALDALKRERGVILPVVTLSAVVTSLNYTEMPDILRFAAGLGIWNVLFIPLTVHNEEMAHLKLTGRQMKRYQRAIRESMALVETLPIYHTNLSALLDSRITTETGEMVDVILSRRGHGDQIPSCLAPWTSLVVHPDGSLNPCQHNSKATRIGDRTLEEAWRKDRYLEWIRKRQSKGDLPAFCQMCCSAVVAEMRAERESLPAIRQEGGGR